MRDFDFLGFVVSDHLVSESRKRLKQVLKLAPGLVNYDAYVVKTRAGLYEGALKIHTAWDTFQASSASNCPHEVVETLVANIREQISNWRRGRSSVLPSGRQWIKESNEALRRDGGRRAAS